LLMFMHLHGDELEFDQNFINQQAKKNKGKGKGKGKDKGTDKGKVEQCRPTAQQVQIAMNYNKNGAVFLTYNGDPADGGYFGVMLGAATKKHTGTMVKPTSLRTLVTHKARKEGNVDMAMIDRSLEHTADVSAKHYNITDSEQHRQQALAFAAYYKFGEPSESQTEKRVRASVKPMKRPRVKQAEYREDKAHCAMPGCGGEGLHPCNACKRPRYCGRACQVAHWEAHEADCKRCKVAKMGKGQ
jgi:hypothetical protein